MIKKYLIIVVVIFTFISFWAVSLFALGIGVYTTGKAGVSTFEISNTGFIVNYSLGAGFVLDTAVASNELFNYRLNVGYENIIDSGYPFFKNGSTNRISVSNTFGLGVIKNKYIRVWAGPQLELAYQFKNSTKWMTTDAPPLAGITNKESVNFSIISLGFGAVAGININTGSLFTLSLEIGLSTSIGVGQYHEHSNGIYTLMLPAKAQVVVPLIPSSNAYDRACGRVEGFSRLSFIFRIADNYTPAIL